MSKEEKTTEQKKELRLFLALFLIIPLLGVALGVVAVCTNIMWLMLIALPMMLTFFVTAGVIIFKSFKDNPKTEEEITQEDYKGDLELDDCEILESPENPYKKQALKSIALIIASIAVPAFLSYLTKDSNNMIGEIYWTNLFAASSILLGFLSVILHWKSIGNYMDFNRAKKILISKKEGEKKPFTMPRLSALAILFLVLAGVVSVIYFQDVATLKVYKENGIEVEAVSYHVETDDEDNYVYFKYTYDNKEYSDVIRNYGGGTKIGNEVKGYIFADKPEELYLYYSNAFAVYIMFGFFCFFLWMENSYRKSVGAFCLAIIGAVAMTMGIVADAGVHIVFGVIMLICALKTVIGKKKKLDNKRDV